VLSFAGLMDDGSSRAQPSDSGEHEGHRGRLCQVRSSEGNTVSVWLKAAGYNTALIGKVMNGYGGSATTHILPGWEDWIATVTGSNYFEYDLNENGTIVHYGTDASDYLTDVLAEKAVQFIQAQTASVPFYLLITPHAPHGPQTPAPRHAGAFATAPLPLPPNFNEADVSDKPTPIRSLPVLSSTKISELTTQFRNRRESLLSVDDLVGSVVSALDSQGLLDNTIVIFTSDNGYSLGSHRWIRKLLLYEESIRVPLVIRGPGVPAGQIRSQLVNNLDVVATIVLQAQASPGNVLDGRSLMPIIADPTAPWRTALLVQGSFKDDDGDGNPTSNLTYFGVRGKRYVYEQISDGERELYDLSTDAFELNNIASSPKSGSIVAYYKNLLGPLSACAGSTCWVTTEPK
jgi:N-acetylglucosamine-6-sulfatase